MIKKHLSIIIILLLTLALMAGCDSLPEDPGETDEARIKIQEEYEALIEASSQFYTMEDYAHYLLKWAASREIRASYDGSGNVIMSRTPSEGYSSQNSLNISVPLNLKDIEKNGLAAATALSFLDKAAENNFMRLIFTNDEDPGHPGAVGLNKRFLNAANHILLQWDPQGPSEDLSVRIGGAGYSRHVMEKEITTIPSSYPIAYTVSIDGLQGGDTSSLSSRNPNPIKILGDLLATWKSEGILYELASFEGVGEEGQYPESAALTILLNDNDVKRFLNSGEKAKKKFIDDYGDKEPDALFLIEEVSRPEIVLSPSSGDSIVSLMYTLVNGIVERDEEKGEIQLFSQMERVSTSNNRFVLEIGGRFLQKESNDNLNEMLLIIAGLSEVTHQQIDEFPAWITQESSPLLVSLVSSAKLQGKEVMTYQDFFFDEASIFSQYENLGDLVSLSIHEANAESVFLLLIDAVKIKEPPGGPPS